MRTYSDHPQAVSSRQRRLENRPTDSIVTHGQKTIQQNQTAKQMFPVVYALYKAAYKSHVGRFSTNVWRSVGGTEEQLKDIYAAIGATPPKQRMSVEDRVCGRRSLSVDRFASWKASRFDVHRRSREAKI